MTGDIEGKQDVITASTFTFTRRAALGALMAASALATVSGASADMLDVEKDELTFGFIKLTDMAPLAVAYEHLRPTR